MNEPIYCCKFKKKTNNVYTITTQNPNGRWRASAQCLKCKTNKSQFIQEDKMLLAKELHKPVRIHFKKKKPILTKGNDDLWPADLIDMKKCSGENNGYSYLLNVVNIFSKFAWALPIKT